MFYGDCFTCCCFTVRTGVGFTLVSEALILFGDSFIYKVDLLSIPSELLVSEVLIWIVGFGIKCSKVLVLAFILLPPVAIFMGLIALKVGSSM